MPRKHRMHVRRRIKIRHAEAQVEIGMHHWPSWGEAVVKHIKAQRDIYKFLHDQTLHYANLGFTMNELPAKVVIPESLTSQWSTHGYYGSQSHNVRAVYNYYLGYFDGNPANLNPLPPEEVAVKYVEAMGGAEALMNVGRRALASGEYRWGAEAMKHLVFAKPDNQAAKNLLADLLEQQGYQAEAGTWRNFYLGGAKELRDGVKQAATPDTASPDITGNMSSALIFGYMGIQLDAQKAAGKKITLNWSFPDTKEKHTLFLENSVLNHWPDYQDKSADATIQLDRAVFDEILAKKLSFQDALSQSKVKVVGDATKLSELMGMMTDLGASFWFNIVSP